MDYKVLIPSAGLGSRLGDSYKNLNKSLVSINNKPVISYLIEKFPPNIEIIVALGHKGNLLREYLNIAYDKRKITFVEIDNYCGIGSGLGYTILKCKEYLQCPFIFCPNDTYFFEDVPKPESNWVGYAEVKNSQQYRSILLSNNSYVFDLLDKEEGTSNSVPYIGLSGIRDFGPFWDKMEHGRNYGSINIGEAYAIKALIKSKYEFIGKKFCWYDTGNLESLKKAKKTLKKEGSP